MAAAFLERRGCRILERNFRNRLGEIDLIAQEGETVCFVEVKSRSSTVYGQPQESVHWRKQRKLKLLALSYLKFKFGTVDIMSRFDVITVLFGPAGECRIEHIPNAFDLPG